MADGRPPYHDLHPMKAIFMIPSRPPPTLETPKDFSLAFNAFISKCLTKDPFYRPSATELLQVYTVFLKIFQDDFIDTSLDDKVLLELVNEVAELNAQGGMVF